MDESLQQDKTESRIKGPCLIVINYFCIVYNMFLYYMLSICSWQYISFMEASWPTNY